MNKLDKMIKRERKAKYKRLKRLRVARDMASKHIKQKMLVSKVVKYYSRFNTYEYTILHLLAKDIFDNKDSILSNNRPPVAPPVPRLTMNEQFSKAMKDRHK